MTVTTYRIVLHVLMCLTGALPSSAPALRRDSPIRARAADSSASGGTGGPHWYGRQIVDVNVLDHGVTGGQVHHCLFPDRVVSVNMERFQGRRALQRGQGRIGDLTLYD